MTHTGPIDPDFGLDGSAWTTRSESAANYKYVGAKERNFMTGDKIERLTSPWHVYVSYIRAGGKAYNCHLDLAVHEPCVFLSTNYGVVKSNTPFTNYNYNSYLYCAPYKLTEDAKHSLNVVFRHAV